LLRAVIAGKAAQTSSEMPAKIRFLRALAPIEDCPRPLSLIPKKARKALDMQIDDI
jgi:hypothetical protein